MVKYIIFVLFVLLLVSCNNPKNEFIDKRDGKVYKTITIGNKIWMAENLNYDMDNHGSYYYPQRMLSSNKEQINEALEFYHIDKNNLEGLYGIDLLKKFNPYLDTVINKYPRGWRYYTYDAAKKACPEGWHIPNNEEWTKLNSFLTKKNLVQLNLDSLGYWKGNYHNPILEIRLGDYFGDMKSDNYWSSSETSELIYEAALTSYYDSLYFFINHERKPRDINSNDIAFCIRCVRDK